MQLIQYKAVSGSIRQYQALDLLREAFTLVEGADLVDAFATALAMGLEVALTLVTLGLTLALALALVATLCAGSC